MLKSPAFNLNSSFRILRLRNKTAALFPFYANTLHCQTMSDTLVINEIYLSLQGESTFAGLPCIFIRLTACNLRCSYCDTAYAFTEGKKMPLAEILAKVRELAAPFHKLVTRHSSLVTASWSN